MLTTTEILKKVRELEIKSKKLTTDLFTGEYHSAFKGKGMSFKEVREYAAGDDIRFIDWNVSARFGHPFSKVFEEEREHTDVIRIAAEEEATLAEETKRMPEHVDGEFAVQRRGPPEHAQRAHASHLQCVPANPIAQHADRINHEIH